MSILSKTVYRFNAIRIRIPKALFIEIFKNPKILTEPLKASNTQSNLGKKNKAGSITLSDFKLYCLTIVIKSMVLT